MEAVKRIVPGVEVEIICLDGESVQKFCRCSDGERPTERLPVR